MTMLARRRWLTFGLTLAGLCALLREFLKETRGITDEERALVQRLNALSNASRELSRLGELQRAPFAPPADVGALLRDLFGGLTMGQMGRLSDGALEDYLRRSTESDFESGRIVVVGGWFLARTEANLCRLAVV